ncbi:hypothetical protein ACH5RR_032271 [Cinchona calisaya]|uniref:Uncharacterized protein n=1 Tax=Cinchona calisaya TaxID=153742 RepID=A0ABD2YLQ9_9GENT
MPNLVVGLSKPSDIEEQDHDQGIMELLSSQVKGLEYPNYKVEEEVIDSLSNLMGVRHYGKSIEQLGILFKEVLQALQSKLLESIIDIDHSFSGFSGIKKSRVRRGIFQ